MPRAADSDPFTAIQSAIASGAISSTTGQVLENRIAAIERLAAVDPGLDASLLESRVLAALPSAAADSSPIVDAGSGLFALDSSALGSGSASRRKRGIPAECQFRRQTGCGPRALNVGAGRVGRHRHGGRSATGAACVGADGCGYDDAWQHDGGRGWLVRRSRFPCTPRLPMHPLLETLRQRFALATSHVAIGDWRFELFRPADPDALISEPDFDRDGRLPYWAELWPSATAMAQRLAAERGSGRRLLELGCGLGLATLAAVRAGFEVVATDYYQESLDFTQVNAAQNGLAPPATRLVDWRRLPDDLGRFDLVVASDVLFERPNVALVAAAFARTIAPAGRGWLTEPGRPPAAAFPIECERYGLEIAEWGEIPVAKAEKSAAPQLIHFFELTHASL